MRYEPFSSHDRSSIIAHLAKPQNRKWDGARDGYSVRIVRADAPKPPRIHFAVEIRHTWISDRAETVGEAIDELNRIIGSARARRAPVIPITTGRQILAAQEALF